MLCIDSCAPVAVISKDGCVCANAVVLINIDMAIEISFCLANGLFSCDTVLPSFTMRIFNVNSAINQRAKH